MCEYENAGNVIGKLSNHPTQSNGQVNSPQTFSPNLKSFASAASNHIITAGSQWWVRRR
jgi:hypothetical protein